jgi:uncharacterized protein (DUF433 family)
MSLLEIGKHFVIDPGVCFGKLTFRGTRVPVEAVLARLAKGKTIEYIQGSWPYLKREAVEEAIQLAAVAWPEMMRKGFSKRIQLLAKGLRERSKKRANRSREPAHIGRSA